MPGWGRRPGVHNVAESLDAADTDGAGLLGNLVLARIASAARPIDKGEIAADLSPFAGAQTPASRWREAVVEAIDAPKPGGLAATSAGAAAAARFLGVGGSVALTWEKACNVWLIAKALGRRRA